MRLVNNATGTAYVSQAPTDANGLFTYTAPPGQYTTSTSPTGNPPWTGTGDSNYAVAPTLLGYYNVLDYSADPTGAIDSTSAIQAALDACRLAGGGTVYAPAGTYKISLSVNPLTATYYAALFIGPNTAFRGAGRSATTFKLAASQAQGRDNVAGDAWIIGNRQLAPTAPNGDENITCEDFTLDGNAANQTHTHQGLYFFRVRGLHVNRVRSTNCRGTGTSGTAESAHIGASLSTDLDFVECIAAGTAGQTSDGIGLQSSSHARFTSCTAYGMVNNWGFGMNTCRHITYVNCHGYSNGSEGFNAEVSDDISYTACHAGGQSTTNASQYPWAGASQSLGNTTYGFVVNNSTRVVHTDCHARKNGLSGIFYITTPAGAGNRLVSGDYSDSTGGAGILCSAAIDATNLRVTGGPALTGNSLASFIVGGYNSGNGQNIPANVVTVAVPATTVALTNPLPFDIDVFITPGASTCAVALGGTATGVVLASGGVGQMFRWTAGTTITLTYTAAPSWTWFIEE